MTVFIWVFSISALIIGLAFRLLLLRFPSSDEDLALWMIDKQRGHRWVNFEATDSVISGQIGYPCLLHYLISRGNKGAWIVIGRVVNIVSDLVVALIVGLLAHRLAVQVGINSSLVAVEAAALFMLMPILILPGEARHRGISARSFGCFLVVLYGVAVGMAVVGESVIYLLSAFGFFILIILSSQFALQAAVFISIFLAVLMGTWQPLMAAGIGLVLGWMIPGLGTREVLRHMFNHKIWYCRNAKLGTPAGWRNKLGDVLSLPVLLLKDWRQFAAIICYRFTPTIAFFSVPALFCILIFWALGQNEMMQLLEKPEAQFAASCLLAASIVFVLISIPPLAFLGEAERYFEYAVPAASVLGVVWMAMLGPQGEIYFIAIISFQILVYLILYGMEFYKKGNAMEEADLAALKEASGWVRSQKGNPGLATVPIKLGFRLAMMSDEARNRVRFYYYWILRPRDRGFSYMEGEHGIPQKCGTFEVPAYLPGSLKDRWGVGLVLVDREMLPNLRVAWAADAFRLEQPINNNARYLLIDLNHSPSTIV